MIETAMRMRARIVYPLLTQCIGLWKDGLLQSYDLVGIYILSLLAIRKPKSWCSGRLLGHIADRSAIMLAGSSLVSNYPTLLAWLDPHYLSKKLQLSPGDMDHVTVVDLFNQLRFNNIKSNRDDYVNKCIVGWCLGTRPFQLMFYIPSSEEVLHQQSGGQRVITIFTTEDELSSTHMSKLTYMRGAKCHERDPLEFALHDMKHMEHFVSADTHMEQVGFFRCLYDLNGGDLRGYFSKGACRLDALFWDELEYVISDMNCYSTHLLRYLYAKVLEAVRRGLVSRPCDSVDKHLEDDGTVNPSCGSIVPDVGETAVRSAVETMWGRILRDIGMVPVTVGPEGCINGEDIRDSAYGAAMELVRVSYRERTGWTEREGDCIRHFFKSKSTEGYYSNGSEFLVKSNGIIVIHQNYLDRNISF